MFKKAQQKHKVYSLKKLLILIQVSQIYFKWLWFIPKWHYIMNAKVGEERKALIIKATEYFISTCITLKYKSQQLGNTEPL